MCPVGEKLQSLTCHNFDNSETEQISIYYEMLGFNSHTFVLVVFILNSINTNTLQ